MVSIKLPKISFNAPIILGFTLACLLVLILDYMTDELTTDLFFSVYNSSLLSPLTYIRFFGHVLGHVDWEHFISNIMLILMVGPLLEEKYGSDNIALIIVTTALVTGVINFIVFPDVQLLGASGVVFAFIILSSITSIKDGEIPLTFVLVTLIYIGEQIYDGLFLEDDVSNITHIIGGIVGAYLGFAFNKKKLNRNTL